MQLWLQQLRRSIAAWPGLRSTCTVTLSHLHPTRRLVAEVNPRARGCVLYADRYRASGRQNPFAVLVGNGGCLWAGAPSSRCTWPHVGTDRNRINTTCSTLDQTPWHADVDAVSPGKAADSPSGFAGLLRFTHAFLCSGQSAVWHSLLQYATTTRRELGVCAPCCTLFARRSRATAGTLKYQAGL